MEKQGKRVLKENENLISKIAILQEELINVKKENGDLICEKKIARRTDTVKKGNEYRKMWLFKSN